VAAGFATAAVKARIVDHTVLRATAYGVAVSGFVDSREERERSDRIVLRLAGMEGARLTLPQPSPTCRQAALAACEPSQRS
jgi:competence protein ComEC